MESTPRLSTTPASRTPCPRTERRFRVASASSTIASSELTRARRLDETAEPVTPGREVARVSALDPFIVKRVEFLENVGLVFARWRRRRIEATDEAIPAGHVSDRSALASASGEATRSLASRLCARPRGRSRVVRAGPLRRRREAPWTRRTRRGQRSAFAGRRARLRASGRRFSRRRPRSTPRRGAERQPLAPARPRRGAYR
jgi:hypothetical protein